MFRFWFNYQSDLMAIHYFIPPSIEMEPTDFVSARRYISGRFVRSPKANVTRISVAPIYLRRNRKRAEKAGRHVALSNGITHRIVQC